jgi:Zn finger protein HypA/HybF involved in hydrogenase expression
MWVMVFRCEACRYEAEEDNFHVLDADGDHLECPRCHSEDVFDKAETEAMVKAQKERGGDG